MMRLIAIVLLINIAYAQPAAEALLQHLRDIHSLAAHFSQSVRDGKGQLLQRSEGTMALLRPGKLRWSTTKPSQQLLLVNDKKLWIYDVDLMQVTISKVTTQGLPALLLSDDPQAIIQEYAVEQSQADHFSLVPKTSKSSFKRIQLSFAGEQLRRMQLLDRLGQVTQIVLSDGKQNRKIAEAQFRLSIPKDVDVMDNTE